MIFRKGSKPVKMPVYVPADVTTRLDQYFQDKTRFLSARGIAWTKKTLSTRFTDASKVVYGPDYDGPSITSHILRHAYASASFIKLSKLFHAGIITEEPLLVVQELLAHASYQTTWGTYIHMFAKDGDDREEDADLFDIDGVVDVLAVMQIKQFADNRRMNEGPPEGPECFLPLQ
jgi:integrase